MIGKYRIMSFYLIKCFFIVVLAARVESCLDAAPNCADLKLSGYCNSTYYTDVEKVAKCAFTCRLCIPVFPYPLDVPSPAPIPECVDTSAHCVQWASNGYCTSTSCSASQKAKYCAKTCSLCPKPPTTPKPDPSCYDASPKCPSYQLYSFCTSPYYTQEDRVELCAKTCGLCNLLTTTLPTTTRPPAAYPTTPKSSGGGGYGK